MFHPAVRNEKQNWQLYLDSINELLKCDGFEIIPNKTNFAKRCLWF